MDNILHPIRDLGLDRSWTNPGSNKIEWVGVAVAALVSRAQYDQWVS